LFLIVGTFTRLLKNLKVISHYQEVIERVAGAMFIALELYFIWVLINIRLRLNIFLK